jgi:hypothetical protein
MRLEASISQSVVGTTVVGPTVVGTTVVGTTVVGTTVVGPTVVGPTVVGSATIRREATHARRTDRAAGVAGNTQPRYSVDASANLDPCARSTRPGGAELGPLMNIYVSCDRHLSRLRRTLRWRSSRWRYSYVRRRSRNAQPPPPCAQGPARSPCGPDLFKRAVWSGTGFLRLLEAAAVQPGLRPACSRA